MENDNQYCTFRLNGHFFGVSVRVVQEVIRSQDLTRVPLAETMVKGLINLRGQIVTALDLRCCLNMPEREPGSRPMNIVVRTGDGAISCLVDEIGDVVEVSDEYFEAPPDTLTGVAKDLITGCFKLEGQLLLILDVERALGVEVN